MGGAEGGAGRFSPSLGMGHNSWLQAVLGKLKLDINLKLFTERTVGHWNKLPREVAPSPLLVKKYLDDSQLV